MLCFLRKRFENATCVHYESKKTVNHLLLRFESTIGVHIKAGKWNWIYRSVDVNLELNLSCAEFASFVRYIFTSKDLVIDYHSMW